MTQRWAQDIRSAARQSDLGEDGFYGPLLSPVSGNAFKPASLTIHDVREVLGLAELAQDIPGRTVFGPEQDRNVELISPRKGDRTSIVVRATLSDEQLDALGVYVSGLVTPRD